MTLLEAAYTAGLIDGEGHIGLYSHRSNKAKATPHYIRVAVQMTHKKTLDWLARVWGGKVNTYQGKKEHWKDEHVWMVWGDDALILLEAIRPYLITKPEQAELAIAFQRQKQWRRNFHRRVPILEIRTERKMAELMKALNQ